MFEIGGHFDRYTIEALLGQGGMGEVYRAYDARLQRRVALKILRAASDPAGSQGSAGQATRLLREARAAAALAHPNVVSIFDVGELDGTTFLAMELIEGRPLRSYVGADVAMETRLAWLADIGRALAAAHKKGLVHRDIKPENVMVGDDGVLKVLDFGIAHKSRALATLGTATEAGATTNATGAKLVGTPMYMPPEQMRGEPLDGRADQFAWGVLAYELLSGGASPWPGATDLVGLVAAVLSTDAQPLPAAPGLPPHVAAIVERTLRRSPGERFPSMDDAISLLATSSLDLRRLAVPPTQPPPGATRIVSSGARAFDALGETIAAGETEVPAPVPARRPGRKRLLAIAGALAAAGLVALGVASMRRPTAQPDTGVMADAAAGRRSIAVVGFKNLSGREDVSWIGTALSETMTSELAMGEQLRTISVDDVVRMKRDLSLAPGDGIGPDALPRVGKRLGAELVVTGAYLAVGGKIRLDARLLDTRTGQPVTSISESGQEGELIDIVSRAGASLRRSLRVREVSAEQAGGLRASQPASAEGARAYADGLAKLRAFDAIGARASFEKLVAAEPRFAPGHAALADAFIMLGMPELAGEAAKRAADLAQGLPREERLLIEARYDEATEAWPKATEIYQSLHDLFPDNLDYGLALARVQWSGARGGDALGTIAALRRLPPPLGDDPRLDLEESEAYRTLGDGRSQTRAAAAARVKADALGATTLGARARQMEAFWLTEAGEPARATQLLEEAMKSATATGDQLLVTEVRSGLSLAYSLRGDPAAAADQDLEGIRVLDRMGNASMASIMRSNRAVSLVLLGRLDEALADIEAAARAPEPAVGAPIMGARIAAIRGDLGKARAGYETSLQGLRQAHNERMVAWVEMLLGDVALDEGKLDEAEALARTSLATKERLGLKVFAAESRLLLGRVKLARGAGDEAERDARAAAETFAAERATDREAGADALLARILVGARRPADAAAPLSRAKDIAQTSQAVGVRMEVSVAAALVDAARGDADGARKALGATIAEATKLGFVGALLDARLALARLDLGRGDAGERRAALVRDAEARGFRRIADEAKLLQP